MTRENCILYLVMHDSTDGMRVFKAGTKYDWYVLQKKQNTSCITKARLEDNQLVDIKLLDWLWLPNKSIKEVEKLIGKEEDEKVPIIFSRSAYGTDKKHVFDKKDNTFKYPLIHSTPKTSVRYMYSSKNDLGMFGVPKVIFGDSGVHDVIIDLNGEYGMTEHAMGIQVSDVKEATLLAHALRSIKFQKLLKEALQWSNFQIDWRLFTCFKRDWYKYFQE